jgi:hypothetical protein
MGQSEGRTTTFTWEADPAKPDPKAESRQKQAINRVQQHSLAVHASTSIERWPGTAYELARKVELDLIKAGKDISAPKVFTAGLQQACQVYVNSKGKPFTPKVLRESLRQWRVKNVG